MPLSEYKGVVGGGLKLKGVKDGRVKKSKKKDKRPSKEIGEGLPDDAKSLEVEDAQTDIAVEAQEDRVQNKYGKTDAQLRFEERRKKRLEEQAEKEGVKTHKEKVEALNNYLSKLSEHNDMPRIGPG